MSNIYSQFYNLFETGINNNRRVLDISISNSEKIVFIKRAYQQMPDIDEKIKKSLQLLDKKVINNNNEFHISFDKKKLKSLSGYLFNNFMKLNPTKEEFDKIFDLLFVSYDIFLLLSFLKKDQLDVLDWCIRKNPDVRLLNSLHLLNNFEYDKKRDLLLYILEKNQNTTAFHKEVFTFVRTKLKEEDWNKFIPYIKSYEKLLTLEKQEVDLINQEEKNLKIFNINAFNIMKVYASILSESMVRDMFRIALVPTFNKFESTTGWNVTLLEQGEGVFKLLVSSNHPIVEKDFKNVLTDLISFYDENRVKKGLENSFLNFYLNTKISEKNEKTIRRKI